MLRWQRRLGFTYATRSRNTTVTEEQIYYFNRNQGDRRENLERSIECFHKSLEIYRQDEFPEKWKINQEDLRESYRELKLLPEAIQNGNNKLSAEYIIRTAQSHESRIRANLIRANLTIFAAQSHFALL